MTNPNSDSFIEQCIAALPPEKREAARQAFHDLGDGDGSAISKLLVVLESNAAFASTIPAKLANVADSLAVELRDFQKQDAKERTEATKRLTESVTETLKLQVPALGKAIALDRVVGEMEQSRHQLARLEHSVGRLRHVRLGMVLFGILLGTVSIAAIGGGVFWERIQRWRHNELFLARLEQAGLQMQITSQSDGSPVLRIEGPLFQGTAWRKDRNNTITGVDLAFEEGR